MYWLLETEKIFTGNKKWSGALPRSGYNTASGQRRHKSQNRITVRAENFQPLRA